MEREASWAIADVFQGDGRSVDARKGRSALNREGQRVIVETLALRSNGK
jgi:hypothetical protein